MDMKKLLATVLLMSSTVAFSQEQRIKEPEKTTFTPHWFIQAEVGLPPGDTDSHDQSADWSRNDRGWQGWKRALSPVGRAPFCMEKYQSLTCSGRLSP